MALTPIQLPDEFNDFYTQYTRKKSVNSAVVTFCHRELFHEQWKALLDDEFIDAYEHGIVVRSADGVDRRWFPRILTYSADYPEKYARCYFRDFDLTQGIPESSLPV